MSSRNSFTGKPPAFKAGLLLLTLAPLYYASYRYRLMHPYGGLTKSAHLNLPSSPSSNEFVRDWLSTQPLNPYNPFPLKTYCNRTTWHPNLVFRLSNANGGIGNVRGNILDFLFFAIEAGASIILPGMARRDETDISNVWATRAEFGDFFDEEWFLHALGMACPHMAVYKPEPGRDLSVEALPGNYLPRTRRMDADAGNTREEYLKHLDAWLKGSEGYQPQNLTLVNLERTLWEIDTRSLPPGLRRNFGQLLRIKPSIRRLAAIAVQNLALKYNLHTFDPRIAIPKHAFYAAHLRTEADAQAAGWLNSNDAYANFSAQTTAYIAHALRSTLHVMYVASGNSTDLSRFALKASTHNPPVNVTSKSDLLPPNEAAALRELSWDQQALVDYEVLMRSSVFGGFVKSSFSFNLAISRGQVREDEGLVREPWRVVHVEEGVAFDDGVSRVLGRDGWHEGRIPRGMWP